MYSQVSVSDTDSDTDKPFFKGVGATELPSGFLCLVACVIVFLWQFLWKHLLFTNIYFVNFDYTSNDNDNEP